MATCNCTGACWRTGSCHGGSADRHVVHFTGRPIDGELAEMMGHRKPLVEQIGEILGDGDRQKISDTRKQLLFGVDLIDTWLGRNT